MRRWPLHQVNNLKAELEKAERTQARLQQRKLELQGQSAPDDEAVEDARKHAEEQAKLEERRQPSEAAYRSKGSAFLPAKRNVSNTSVVLFVCSFVLYS